MRSIYIAIPDNAADKLRELARREFRAPRQQAAILVLAGLKRAGMDPDQRPEDPAEPPGTADRSPRASRKAAHPERPGRRSMSDELLPQHAALLTASSISDEVEA